MLFFSITVLDLIIWLVNMWQPETFRSQLYYSSGNNRVFFIRWKSNHPSILYRIYTAIKRFHLPFVIRGNVIICTKGCQILELYFSLLLSALNIVRLQELLAFSQLPEPLNVPLADNGWTTNWKYESLVCVLSENIFIVCSEEVFEE